ncbi:MAG: hypothetical protein HQL90_00820 [Magnetococcales bacterium]|nr:hypothetical protein [Magnetococcales bacterium]
MISFSDKEEKPAPTLPEPVEQGGSRSLLLSVSLCLALSLALWAGRWGLAGLYAYPARLLLESWEQSDPTITGGQSFDAERWQMAMDTLTRAQWLESNNADLYYLAGRLHHQHALHHPPWSPQAKAYWHQSILAYQHALQLRPNWGYLWILLAQARLQAGEPSTLAMTDWMRAVRFAPHSRDVRLTAIRIGFALWPHLDPQQQALVDTLTKHAMPLDGEMILQQAAKYDLLHRVQPFLDNNPLWQRIYDRLSKNR